MFEQIYIGVTNRCSAKCFTCNREVYKNYIGNPEMPLEIIEKAVDATKRIIYIGEMGDFPFHPQSLEIAKMTVDKGVWFRTETHGAVHGDDYWIEMAEISKRNGSVVRFCIDDIWNDLHRVNVNTEHSLNNLEAFIKAGGHAAVKTILFDFNHKNVDRMADIFKAMGVQRYSTIRSRVYQDSGPLSAPPGQIGTLNTCAQIVKGKGKNLHVKDCPWKRNKICYINEFGEVKACCHLVFESMYFAEDVDDFMRPWIDEPMFADIKELYERNKDKITLYAGTVEEAYNNEFNQTLMNNPNDYMICKFRCNLPTEMKDKILYETEIF